MSRNKRSVLLLYTNTHHSCLHAKIEATRGKDANMICWRWIALLKASSFLWPLHFFFILSRASRACTGPFFSVLTAFSTFNDESLGLFASQDMVSDETGMMNSESRSKVSAIRWANSYLVTGSAPARWNVPVCRFSTTSKIISARLVLSVGELRWSVTTFTSCFFSSLLMSHKAKLILPAAGIAP